MICCKWTSYKLEDLKRTCLAVCPLPRTIFSFSQCVAIVFLFKTWNLNNMLWKFHEDFFVFVDVICACPLLQVRQVWYWLAYFALDTFNIWSHSVILLLGLTSVPGNNSRVSTYVCWCIGMYVQSNLTLNSRSLSSFALIALRWTASSATWLFHCLSFSFHRHIYKHKACSSFSTGFWLVSNAENKSVMMGLLKEEHAAL